MTAWNPAGRTVEATRGESAAEGPRGRRRTLAILLGLAAGAMAGGCGDVSPGGQAVGADGDDRPWNIVCTVGMVADIVRQVSGETGRVGHIIGEGVDPHLYTPTRADLIRLREADVIFYSGLMLEGRMADALVKVARRGRPVYAVTELIDESDLLAPAGSAGHHDPHVWMDVGGWMKAVEAVAASMAEFDPPHAAVYHANAAGYLEQLAALDDYVRTCIGSIPGPRRVLITAHDAFNYFGRAYDIEVLGIQGISTESEAGLEDINRLVELLVTRRIGAVFVETSVADKNVRALIEGARARDETVIIGGALFSDAMGPPGTYEGSYIGMIDHNTTVITRALGGIAPPGGMTGRLAAADAP